MLPLTTKHTSGQSNRKHESSSLRKAVVYSISISKGKNMIRAFRSVRWFTRIVALANTAWCILYMACSTWVVYMETSSVALTQRCARFLVRVGFTFTVTEPARGSLRFAHPVELSGGHVCSEGGPRFDGRVHCRLKARYASISSYRGVVVCKCYVAV